MVSQAARPVSTLTNRKTGMPNIKSPTLLERVSALPHDEQVKHWGSAKPWGKKESPHGSITLQHSRNKFSPEDVQFDDDGNITAQPLTVGKPCFGRMEIFLRHGSKVRTYRTKKGAVKESTKHQCGQCLIRKACRKAVTVRLRARPKALAAFLKWRKKAIAHLGSKAKFNEILGRNHTIYTGASHPELGYLWGAFLRELGNEPPFTSCNDIALRKLDEEKLVKLRIRRRKNKAAERARNRAAGRLPDEQFCADVEAERERRLNLLLGAREDSAAPSSISKLDDRGCWITAAVWREKSYLEECGTKPTAGKIAKRLKDNEAVRSLTEGSLRDRIYRDLERIEMLERQPLEDGRPLWSGFDPLKSAEAEESYNFA